MKCTRMTRLACVLAFLLMAFSSFLGGAQAARTGNRHHRGRAYHVGDEAGWTDEGVDYAKWSRTKKFYIGDKLVFKYEKDRYRVLEVNLEDFRDCNPLNPIRILDSGHDTLTMTQRSHRFFIGDKQSCFAGQKVDIRVPDAPPGSSPIKSHQSPTTSPSPSPTTSPSPSPSQGRSPSPNPISSPSPRQSSVTPASRKAIGSSGSGRPKSWPADRIAALVVVVVVVVVIFIFLGIICYKWIVDRLRG